MAERINTDDLAFAAEWLDAYDGTGENGDTEGEAAAHKVATWLRAEVTRREHDAAIRAIVTLTGCTPARARDALRKAMSETPHP